MKKKIFFNFVCLSLVSLFVIGCSKISQESSDYEKLLIYYRTLAKECEGKTNHTCCMASVDKMMRYHYKQEPEEGCPPLYKSSSNICWDSYVWCEPLKNAELCEYYDGEYGDITDCNGRIKNICTLPNGESCYLPYLKDGQCIDKVNTEDACSAE